MSRTVSILGYHKIGPWSPSAWETWFYVPTEAFERQMRQLRDGGWNVIDADAFLRALRSPVDLPDKAVLITFDDAYRSVLQHALPVLHRFNYSSVVFVPTAAVGRTSSRSPSRYATELRHRRSARGRAQRPSTAAGCRDIDRREGALAMA